jgi:hypothetical protein
VDVNSIIDNLTSDTITEQINNSDEMCDDLVSETMLNVVYDPEIKYVPSQHKT